MDVPRGVGGCPPARPAAPGDVRGRRVPLHAGARAAGRPVHADHGRGRRPVRAIGIIAGMTLREAARRRILWTAAIAAVLLLVVFGVALRLQVLEFQSRSLSPFLRYQVENGMLIVGLYTCDLLAVVMTILTSIDTLAGEMSSGTIHAIATKPITRWQIFAGKFLGFAGMSSAYVAL